MIEDDGDDLPSLYTRAHCYWRQGRWYEKVAGVQRSRKGVEDDEDVYQDVYQEGDQDGDGEEEQVEDQE